MGFDMICKNCNCEITRSGSAFCPNCGAKLEAVPVIQPEAAPKGKKKTGLIIIISVIALCILIAAGIFVAKYFGLFGDGEGTDEDTEDRTEKNADGEKEKEDVYVSIDIGDGLNEKDTDRGNAETVARETEPAVEITEKAEETDTETDFPEDTVPETVPAEPIWEGSDRVVIANGGLNMRKSPSTSGAIVSCIPNGNIITVEKVQNNWAYVSYGGKQGWCSCDYLFVPLEIDLSPIYSATVRCSDKIEMVSEGYAEDDLVYTDIYNGTTVQVYEIDGDTAFIKYNNIYGTCPAKYLVRK